jgi:hypothetical protein
MKWLLLLKTKLNEKLWKDVLTVDEPWEKLIFINDTRRGHTCPRAKELHIIKYIPKEFF